ncbi:hypothetical protein, partial [Fischerella thermalis]|uniref:hypothetical protein n=1 Tax=Fischerella thermalis TaxID=372787 RepID=UPI001C687A8B
LYVLEGWRDRCNLNKSLLGIETWWAVGGRAIAYCCNLNKSLLGIETTQAAQISTYIYRVAT